MSKKASRRNFLVGAGAGLALLGLGYVGLNSPKTTTIYYVQNGAGGDTNQFTTLSKAVNNAQTRADLFNVPYYISTGGFLSQGGTLLQTINPQSISTSTTTAITRTFKTQNGALGFKAGNWFLDDSIGSGPNYTPPVPSPRQAFNDYFYGPMNTTAQGDQVFSSFRPTTGTNQNMGYPFSYMTSLSNWYDQFLTYADNYPNIESHFLIFMTDQRTDDPYYNNLVNNEGQWQNLQTLCQAIGKHYNVWVQLEYEYITEFHIQSEAALATQIEQRFADIATTSGCQIEDLPTYPVFNYREYPFFTSSDSSAASCIQGLVGSLGVEFGEETNETGNFPAPVQAPADPTQPANVNGWNQSVFSSLFQELATLEPISKSLNIVSTSGFVNDSSSYFATPLWINPAFRALWTSQPFFQQHFVKSGVTSPV